MKVQIIFAHLGLLAASAAASADAFQGLLPRHRLLRRRLDEGNVQTIKLLAAEYVAMEGIVVENSTEGAGSIGWIDQGDWAAYNVTLPSAGTYDLKLEIASPAGDGSLSVTNFDTNQEYAVVNEFPNTEGWQNWETVSAQVDLPGGFITLKLNFQSSGWNMLSLDLSGPVSAGKNESSASVGYSHVFETGSLLIPASEYFSTEGIVVEDSFAGGSDIGSLDEGIGRLYELEIQVASPDGEGALSITDFENNQEYATLDDLPTTGGWQNWETVSVPVELPEGTIMLKMNVKSAGWNMLSMELFEPIFGPTLIKDDEDKQTSVTYEHIFETGSLVIPASEFSSMEGIALENSTEGSINIGSLDAGDWAAYSVTLPSAGNYDLKIRVASPEGEGGLSITDLEGEQEYATINDLPSTGDWQSWDTVSVPVELSEGSFTLKMNVQGAGWNMLSLELSGPLSDEKDENTTNIGYQHTFESGTLLILANEYSSMEGIVIESSSEGGSSIGWLDAGDTVAYNVSIPSSGLYKLKMRVASPSGNGAFSITDSANQEFALMTRLPQTGDWQNWQTISFDFTLQAGPSTLVVNILRSGWNLLWLEVSRADEETFDPQDDEFRLKIPADKFLSMQGIVVETLTDGNRYVGWLDTDDWVTYEITLPMDGIYGIDMHIASPDGSGAFELSNLDTREVYAFTNNLTSTGDWQTWTTTRLNATFSAGPSTLKLQVLVPGWNLLWLEISGPLSRNETDGTPKDDDEYIVSEADFRVRISAANYSSMEGIETETSSEGSDGIVSLDEGDNVSYELSLPSGGLYGVQMRVSSPSGEGAFALKNMESGDEYAFIDRLPITEDAQRWENISFNASLPGGFLPLQLVIVSPGWNLLWIEFTLLESSQNNTDYEQFQVTINATDYSSMEGVEVQELPGVMKRLGNLETGDWIAYNTSIPYDGTYKLKMQITSPSGEGGFDIADMETDVIYANVNTLAATGSWENVGDVTRIILLPAGPISLMVRVLQPGWNLVALSLEKVLPLSGADGGGFIIEAPDTINGKPSWDEPVIRDPWTPILEDPVIRDPTVAFASREVVRRIKLAQNQVINESSLYFALPPLSL